MRSLFILAVVSFAALSLAGCAADADASDVDTQSSANLESSPVGTPAGIEKLAKAGEKADEQRPVDLADDPQLRLVNEPQTVTHSAAFKFQAPQHQVVLTPHIP